MISTRKCHFAASYAGMLQLYLRFLDQFDIGVVLPFATGTTGFSLYRYFTCAGLSTPDDLSATGA